MDRLDHPHFLAEPDFRTLFETAPDAYVVLAPDFTITAASDAYLRASATQRAEILHRSVFDVFPDNPDDPGATGQANLRTSLERVLQTGEPDQMPVQKYDIRVPGTDGGKFEERYWSPVNLPVFDAQGRLTHILHRVQDVTARTRDQMRAAELASALQAVGDSETRFREIANAMPQIVWTARHDGFVDWYNNWWYDYTGARRGSNWDDTGSPMHPDDVQPTHDRWRRSLATGEPYQMEYRFRRAADGEYRWHLGRAVPIRDASGDVARWIGSNTDVHDQKLANEALADANRRAERAREDLYRFLMQSPQPVARLSGPDHRFTLANAAWRRLVGMDPIGRTVGELLTPGDDALAAPLDQVFHGGRPFQGSELLFRRRADGSAGEPRWLNVSYLPDRNEVGTITGVLAFVQDVTDEVVARKVIERQQERIHRYAEAMPQMAFMTDAQGEVTYYNSQHYEYFGVERAENEGSRWKSQSIVHPDDLPGSVEAWTESVRTGRTYQVQYRLRRRDGTFRWHLARAIPDRDAQGQIRAWYGTNTDIHEQKEVERRLQQEQQLRDRLTNTLAHDVRTPLSTASVAAQILRRFPQDEAARQELVDKIVGALSRVDDLVSGMLDANLAQAGRSALLMAEECDLQVIVGQAVDDLALVHGRRFVVSAEPPIVGFWNRSGLRRVLENLATNAVKYGLPEGPVTVTLRAAGERVHLGVHNQGRPLDDMEKGRLFDLFHRSDAAQASGMPGWGIGLVVVKDVVEAHGGRVTVRSDAADGTLFEVELPQDSRPFLPA